MTMIGVAWVVAAILAPWAFGSALVVLLQDRRPHWALVMGAGWIAGQAVLLVLLYGSFAVSGESHSRWILAILAAGAIALWGWGYQRGVLTKPGLDRLRDEIDEIDMAPTPPRPWYSDWVVAFFVVFVSIAFLVKLYCIIGSHATVLTRGDDAISIWLFKAKVVTVLDALPFDPSHDYYMAGSNPHYPVFPSLMAAWGPLLIGEWNERLATLPWLLFGINLVLLVAGGLRRWLPALPSWLVAYVVASMPLVSVHVYRPGYVDFLLAAFLAGAVLYLLAWRSTDFPRHLILGGLFLVATACMKREGPPIAAIVALGVALTSRHQIQDWSGRTWRCVLGGAALAVLVVAMVVDFREQAETALEYGYHPNVWAALWRHLFVWSSFQFLCWGMIAAVLVVSCRRSAMNRATTIALTLGLAGFVGCVFLFTSQARFALNDQTPSRLFMQVAPAIIVVLAVSLLGRVKDWEGDSTSQVVPGDG